MVTVWDSALGSMKLQSSSHDDSAVASFPSVWGENVYPGWPQLTDGDTSVY